MKITKLIPISSASPTKRFVVYHEELAVVAYPLEEHWTHEVIKTDTILDFHDYDLQGSIIIRGTPDSPPQSLAGHPDSSRRNTVNFPGKGCDWLMLDVDCFEGLSCTEDGVRQFIRDVLPQVFQGVACSVQFSASAGIYENGEPIKAGLNCHITFALNRPLTNSEVKKWLSGLPVDMALYSPVQPHYVTDPQIEEGIDIRLEQRRIFINGTSAVNVPEIKLPPARRRKPIRRSKLNTPTLGQLMACDFIRHYVEVGVKPGEGRYAATRAFCHNVIHADRGVEIIGRALTGHKHENAVKRSLQRFNHPICCSTFLPSIKFNCPNFDGEKCKFGITAPIAIAGRVK
jgi:hypothetical protein